VPVLDQRVGVLQHVIANIDNKGGQDSLGFFGLQRVE
jgi:hypothetical protein